MRPIECDEIKSEALLALCQWYRDASLGIEWPPTKAFKIYSLPSIVMPHIARVDVTPSPFRVYYRAVGQYLCDARGMDFSRKYLDELPIPQKSDLAGWYQMALTMTEPNFYAADQKVAGQSFYYEVGCLPLGSPEDRPRAFIIAEAAQDVEAWSFAVRNREYGSRPPSRDVA